MRSGSEGGRKFEVNSTIGIFPLRESLRKYWEYPERS